MGEEKTTGRWPPSDGARIPPCWREVLLDAVVGPWGPQMRLEDFLDRVEQGGGR